MSDHDIPVVQSSPHDERPESQMYRARTRTGTAVSVRTTNGRPDYIFVRNRRWGGVVEHEEAEALSDQLGKAIVTAEDPATEWGTRYFRTRTPTGTPVSVRMNRPVLRQPEYTTGGVDYVRVGPAAWGGAIGHEAAVALHACLRAALTQ